MKDVVDARVPPDFAARWMGKKVRRFRRSEVGTVVELRTDGRFAEARVRYPSRLPDAETFDVWIRLSRLEPLEEGA